MTAPARSCRFGPLVVDYDDRVLRPRPWTVQQSYWAAERAACVEPGPILELCAGAGQIGLAAAVLSGRDLVQVEADPVAAAYAGHNAVRAGWAGRVEIRTEPMQTGGRRGELFPIIIADPPYLPTAEVGRWPEDPPPAIDGGADGLDLVRVCLAVATTRLRTGGELLLQVAGPAQAEQVVELVAGTGLRCRDMRVIDRRRAILLASRP